jgi:plastocyanin
VRRALVLFFVAALCLLGAPPARAATATITLKPDGSPDPTIANIKAGDSVKWHNDDKDPHVVHLGSDEVLVPAKGDSEVLGPFDAGTYSYTVQNDQVVVGAGQIVAEAPPTTTTQATTTTKPTTTTSSTTTSTSSTTTTTSSTTTTTAPLSSFSAPVSVNDKGGSSAVPLLLGALVIVAGLAGLAYWLWLRSGTPYEDDGPDWTEEPPPTVQGPRI